MTIYPVEDFKYLKSITSYGSENTIPENVESVVCNKSDDDNQDVIENIIDDRREFLRIALSMLYSHKQLRHDQNRKLLSDIDSDIMHNRSKIFEMHHWQKGIHQSVERRRVHLERIISTLYQEKRREENQCWKDILTVSKDILLFLRQYMELNIKNKLILDK